MEMAQTLKVSCIACTCRLDREMRRMRNEDDRKTIPMLGCNFIS